MNEFSRIPPSNVDAEYAMLGSLMLMDRTDPAFDEVRSIIEPGVDFYQEDNKTVFLALCAMRDSGKSIDSVCLHAHLKESGKLDEVGGIGFIATLLNSVPSAAHASHYARIVHEAGCKREIIRVANAMLRSAYGDDGAAEASEIGNAATTTIAKTLNAGRSIHSISAADALAQAYEQLEQGGTELIPTGFRDLDEAIGGIGIGETMILGARPSMGKSTIGRQIAIRTAGKGFPVALVSLEESSTKIARNWFSAATSIDNNRIRRGTNLYKEEWEAIATALPKLARLPVHIIPNAFKMQSIRSALSVLVAKHGIKLVIVDYLQKVQADGKDRYEKVTNASQELSALWKELGVAGLVLAQLKREVETRTDKRPSMSDLRESGQIEQDADSILFLHREDYYGVHRAGYAQTHEAELIIAKMRDGERGRTITLTSELNYQRFADREQRQDLVGAFD